MKIHEYQAKDLLKRNKIVVPQSFLAVDTEDAILLAEKVSYPCVLKAQIHVGGRGKAGAIQIVKRKEEFLLQSKKIFSMTLQNLSVKKLLIEEALNISKEYYLGIILDRSLRKNVLILSAMGGIDIEEISQRHPEKILKIVLDSHQKVDFEKIFLFLDIDDDSLQSLQDLIQNFIKIYFANDAELAEINPLVFTQDKRWVACDAKFIVDDNALFRQKALSALREDNEINELEKIAHHKNIPYVKLDGNVGIIGNGAGLVMTSMDEVSRFGGKPANFLDIGGGAQKDFMTECLQLIYSDSQVEGIFINIFGGITRCDEIALSLIDIMKNPPRNIPVVLRLSGTRSEEGRALIQNSHSLFVAQTMNEGAKKIVSLLGG